MLLDSPVHGAVKIRAFVVADKETAAALAPLFRELGIISQESTDPQQIRDELDRTKYEALVLDLDMSSERLTILERARANPANRNAVVFAIVNGKTHRQEAIARGANFVFEQPLVIEEVRRMVRTARDLMVSERRRYFRCTAEPPRRPRGEKFRRTTGVHNHERQQKRHGGDDTDEVAGRKPS